MTQENNTLSYHALTNTLQAETPAESEIILPDYYPGIMKIIHTDASVLVRSTSVRGDKAYVDGAVEFRIFYLAENDGGYHSVFYQVPFSYATDLHSAEADTAGLRVTAGLNYVNTRALSPQKLYAKAVVSLFLFVYEPTTADTGCDGVQKDLIVRTQTETVSDIVLSSQKIVKLSEEINPGAGVRPSNILRYETSFGEPEKKNLNNKTIVKSDLKIKVIYTEQNSTALRTASAKIPLSQVVETAENCKEEDVCVHLALSDCRLSVKEKGTDESVIDFDGEVCVWTTAKKDTETCVTTDAFSTEKDVTCETKETVFASATPVTIPFEIRDTVTPEAGFRVLDVCTSTALIASSYDRESKMIALNCEMKYEAVTANEDGDYVVQTGRFPFTCSVPSQTEIESVKAEVSFYFSSLDVMTTESGAEVRAVGTACGLLYKTRLCKRVNKVEISDAKAENLHGMVVCMAEQGDDVWQIAKRYHAETEEIKRTNDLTSDIIDKKRLIFIRR